MISYPAAIIRKERLAVANREHKRLEPIIFAISKPHFRTSWKVCQTRNRPRHRARPRFIGLQRREKSRSSWQLFSSASVTVRCLNSRGRRRASVHDSSATLRLSLLHFEIRKSSQVSRIHVRDGPEFESIAVPMQNIIAVLCETLRGFSATGFRGKYEQIDNMFITLVDERRNFPTIYVIQPASDQTEAVIGEILNRRGEFELSVEPGFDRMLIG